MEMNGHEVSIDWIDAAELAAMLEDDGELALLDVREEGTFSRAHLLFASPMPLSRLEERLAALVPRLDVRVVLCDAGDGLVERAAVRMASFGYTLVMGLRGGIDAWRAAGYNVFSGVNVPSKAFGEVVEEHYQTPRMEAAEVKRLIDEGAAMVILDSRPLSEYQRMSIPGAVDCPGAELVYRAPGVIPDPDTLVVVNCAGRTRSIIGTQSLINAGLPNRVVALKDGTMGWELAGYHLDRGRKAVAPEPSGGALDASRKLAAEVARKYNVRRIDRAELDAFRRERDRRTLYIFDVRTPEEYAAGHQSDAVSAPGGQLVQATDLYVGTRNARIVLVDDVGVRAEMTASWLVQMGLPDVYVHHQDRAERTLVAGGPKPRILGLDRASRATITVDELARQLDEGTATLVDLATSLQFRESHILGAQFAIRSRFGRSLAVLPQRPLLVLTSPDGTLARLAVADAADAYPGTVTALEGGTAAWRSAGRAMAAGFEPALDAPDDVWHGPYSPFANTLQAKRDYLSWEVDLLHSMQAEPGVRFRAGLQ